jgi:hypothetical protein
MVDSIRPKNLPSVEQKNEAFYRIRSKHTQILGAPRETISDILL